MKINKGIIFGRLTVLSNLGSRSLCMCQCGSTKTFHNGNLRSGDSKSCGCLRKELVSEKNTKHLMEGSRTYVCWSNMKARCFNEKHHRYSAYGERGITVCDRWRDSFENFIGDMGEAPEGRTIDRINVNGNYEPGNCRWATREQQDNNKRSSVKVDIDGNLKTAAEWSSISGVPRRTIVSRLNLGWGAKSAVFTAVGAKRMQDAAIAKAEEKNHERP